MWSPEAFRIQTDPQNPPRGVIVTPLWQKDSMRWIWGDGQTIHVHHSFCLLSMYICTKRDKILFEAHGTPHYTPYTMSGCCGKARMALKTTAAASTATMGWRCRCRWGGRQTTINRRDGRGGLAEDVDVLGTSGSIVNNTATAISILPIVQN